MQHGILRVGIADEDKKEPYFSFVEAIDLRNMVTWRPMAGNAEEYNKALLRSLERTHDSLWDSLPNRPGWEVIVHHSADVSASENVTLDITFAFHHAYADGVASKLFHRDLLKALNSSDCPPSALKDHVLHLDSPLPLLPGMEALVPFKISWGYLLRTIWNEIVWQDLVHDMFKSQPPANTIPWTSEKICLEPHHVNLRLVEMPQKTLAAVVRACREHDTTLTPLLHVLVAASLARRVPAETAPAFSMVTPIDLRRYAEAEYDVQNKMVGMVSAHEDVFDLTTLSRFRAFAGEKRGDTDAFIWQTASSLSARLKHKVSTLPNDDIAGMLSWVSDWKKFWTDKFGTKRGSTWEVSNIGSFKAADAKVSGDNGWRIVRSAMTQGALPAGAAFSLSVAGVEGEGLWLSLSWQESVVEDQLMEGVAADLKGFLTEFGGQGSFGLLAGH